MANNFKVYKDTQEKTNLRYIEAELFLKHISEMPWYQRFFLRRIINKFFREQLEKYKF